jgi:hypothetical protein
LPHRISELTAAEVDGKKYAQRYPIIRFSKLLEETDRLGDVVLVLDTEGQWSEHAEQAISRTLGYGPKRKTRIVLQAHKERELPRVAALSKELNAGVLLNLQQTTADDAKVEHLVKKFSPLAVVTTTDRFTPWLAERLQTLHTPLLVQTINEHRDIVSLTSAGADGFYTDRYVPFDTFAADPALTFDCGETKASARALVPWTRRDLTRKQDMLLPGCADRKGRTVQLKDCDDGAVLRSYGLAVPPGQALHVELDAEAGSTGTSFWVELVEKLADRTPPKSLRPRETIKLKPKERRTLKLDLDLPQGGRVEVRLAPMTRKDILTLHQLKVFHGDTPVDAPSETDPTPSQAESDAGD